MGKKEVNFFGDAEKYQIIADRKIDEEKYDDALGFLFTAYKADCNNLDVISDIADCYSAMGLYELSNKFWYLFLDRAPEKKFATAYLELAINYFYLDNLWMSGYYFHKKVETDGFISQDGLDQDVIDFISENVDKKQNYYIAYPFNRADYSFKVKTAKRALAVGNIKEAINLYESIPSECMDESISGELAISYFLEKQDDKVLSVCKDSLSRYGENFTAYVNLSTLYSAKGENEKSKYYYKKALELRKGDKEEVYKLATIAIDQGDSKTARDCVEAVLKERPNDAEMLFFYAVASVNLKDYEKAYEYFNKARRINPSNYIFEFYSEFVRSLMSGDGKLEKMLPLKYDIAIPDRVQKQYKKKIKEILADYELAMNKPFKKYFNELRWGVCGGDIEIAKQCIFILTIGQDKNTLDFFKSVLLDGEVSDEIKKIIIYHLVESGYKEKFGVVAGGLFTKIKPRKMLFEKFPDGAVFVSAYAICLARSVFWDIDEKDKIGFSANKIYNRFHEEIVSAKMQSEEISVLIIVDSNFNIFANDRQICDLFNVKYDKVKEMIKLVKGEK